MKTELGKAEPLVSVIMPVYNGGSFLYDSLQSILTQSFSNFEILLLDDGSTDNSIEIAKSFGDERLKVFTTTQNMGIVYQLNKGINLAKGKYLARMDSDDIALPLRLEKQIYFMEENPDIGVCGTWLETIGVSKQEVWTVPEDHEQLSVMTFFGNFMFHPTVVIRSSCIGSGYSDRYVYAEDYELWARLMSNGVKFANVPEVLLRYRVHEGQTSSVSRKIQKKSSERIRMRELNRLGLNESGMSEFLNSLITYELESSRLNDFSLWINSLIINNYKYQIYPTLIFQEELRVRWNKLISSTSSGPSRILALYNNFFSNDLTIKELIKLVIRDFRKNLNIHC